LRKLQQRLAKEVTIMIHSEEDYNTAVEASQILFGKATADALRKLDEDTFLSVFEGVPQFQVAKSEFEAGVDIVELLAVKAEVFPSKGELRRLFKGNAISINKEKVQNAEMEITTEQLIADKYLLVQKGKKNYFLIVAC